MTPSQQQTRNAIRKILLSAAEPRLSDADVPIRTRIGRVEAAARTSALPRRLRMLLLLADGRTRIGDMRRSLPSLRGIDQGFDMLHRMGLVEALPPPFDAGPAAHPARGALD